MRCPTTRREMKAARYLNWRINRRVNDEDTALIARVQEGMASPSYVAGPLGTSEVCLRSLRAEAAAAYSRGAAGAGAAAGLVAGGTEAARQAADRQADEREAEAPQGRFEPGAEEHRDARRARPAARRSPRRPSP